jgi:DNA polymerase I-like protein with 3'-5' exonuclease and polymerase domains
LDHPQSGYERSHLRLMQARTRKLVEDGTIAKSLQNGSYDSGVLQETLDATLRGYSYDTQYGTFLRYSFLRSCSLENLTYRFFPEFADYKDVVKDWDGHFSDAPIDKLALRNSGDCDVTQRLERRFGHQVPQPLVEVYIRAGRTLHRMRDRGPTLDLPNWEQANQKLPPLIKKLDAELEAAAGVAVDCDSPQQVARLLYDVLEATPPEGVGRSTVKTVLEFIQATTKNARVAKSIGLVNQRRALGKMLSTYIRGYYRSAELNRGDLHTIWWLTGTITGRLRSGKGDRGDVAGIINFQNLANNPLLQNLLCSDKNWRKALDV